MLLGFKLYLKSKIFIFLNKVAILYQKEKSSDMIKRFKSAGHNVTIHPNCFISSPENVSVGHNVSFVSFVHIWGDGGLTIGDDCMFGSHTAITTLTHNKLSKKFNSENIASSVVIGNNVWVGSHCIIMPGIKIGNNVVIGAGSVVTKDLEDNAVYAGVPTKKLSDLTHFNEK